jgi:hypothetical protein
MSRVSKGLLTSAVLLCIPACSGGGIDSRNKDLDRPRPVEIKLPETPGQKKEEKKEDKKPAAPDKGKSVPQEKAKSTEPMPPAPGKK